MDARREGTKRTITAVDTKPDGRTTTIEEGTITETVAETATGTAETIIAETIIAETIIAETIIAEMIIAETTTETVATTTEIDATITEIDDETITETDETIADGAVTRVTMTDVATTTIEDVTIDTTGVGTLARLRRRRRANDSLSRTKSTQIINTIKQVANFFSQTLLAKPRDSRQTNQSRALLVLSLMAWRWAKSFVFCPSSSLTPSSCPCSPTQ